LSYATSHGLGRYTFWDVNRDRQCTPADNNGQLSGSCSGVAQNAWDFTKYTTQFAGATPPSTTASASASASASAPASPSASATATGTTTSSASAAACSAPAWNASTAYTGGAVVSYAGHKWTAKWWT